jgi:hypothetical protein
VPAGGFTVDLGDQEVAGSLRSHTEDAPLHDHPQDSRTRPTKRRRRTCFVANPALWARLPLPQRGPALERALTSRCARQNAGPSGQQKQAPDSRAGCNATPFAAQRSVPAARREVRSAACARTKSPRSGYETGVFCPSDRPARPARLPDRVPPRQWSRVAALAGRCARWWVLGVRQGETRSPTAVRQASGRVQTE